MRKIVAWLISSLDGVVESPESWSSPYMNDEVNAEIGAGMAPAGSVLLGRRTYQEMAGYWPQQDGNPFADYLNNSTKYVVSATLDSLAWGNSRLVTGDLAEELAVLKQQPGENLLVLGSPTLVRSLMRQGLLDELTLNICPIVLGSGLRCSTGRPITCRSSSSSPRRTARACCASATGRQGDSTSCGALARHVVELFQRRSSRRVGAYRSASSPPPPPLAETGSGDRRLAKSGFP